MASAITTSRRKTMTTTTALVTPAVVEQQPLPGEVACLPMPVAVRPPSRESVQSATASVFSVESSRSSVSSGDLSSICSSQSDVRKNGGFLDIFGTLHTSKKIVRLAGRVVGRLLVMGSAVSSSSSSSFGSSSDTSSLSGGSSTFGSFTALSGATFCSTDDGTTTTAQVTVADRLNRVFERRPCRMRDMFRVIAIISDATPDEKFQMVRAGVLRRLCALITEYSTFDGNCAASAHRHKRQQRQKRRDSNAVDAAATADEAPSGCSNSTAAATNGTRRFSTTILTITALPPTSTSSSSRGIGYGRGSTKSRWDIERAMEARIAQEEHLMWLVGALTAFLWGDAQQRAALESRRLRRASVTMDAALSAERYPHLCAQLVEEIALRSSVLSLLEHHLSNDSVFDISQHTDFYQSLVELTASLALIPVFLPYLVEPRHRWMAAGSKNGGAEAAATAEKNDPNGKSIACQLIPRFRDILNNYPSTIRGNASPDFQLMDFIRKVNDVAELITRLSGDYLERHAERPCSSSSASSSSGSDSLSSGGVSPSTQSDLLATKPKTMEERYAEEMRRFQVQTHPLVGEDNKPIYGFTFRKELRQCNPHTSSFKDRTKRIAKELASMYNSLPLNASNAIFVCVDESRCDTLKVLISGPDDTPYQNGLFEFDVFFPPNYPLSPPKCAFLTTGLGVVRFNPNLYSDGKICLSILGTWEGRPEEKWNSLCSIMQVLISIQGLIFVKRPYFNEPGFEKLDGTTEGNTLSYRYNLHIENATLLYAIGAHLRHPPAYFRDVIRRHIWLKRDAIVAQAERWLLEVARCDAAASSSAAATTAAAAASLSGAYSAFRVENTQKASALAAANGGSGIGATDMLEAAGGCVLLDDSTISSVIQRQNVRKLIEELRAMKDPNLDSQQ